MWKVLLLLILLAVPALAQDTTCDAGDIAWVKDTENADEGHTLGGASAEYNNFAAPFGIQAVYDEGCNGLLIRIVDGSNDYGSSSTSWTNRDADKAIVVDNVGFGAGQSDASVDTSGWLDETTPCLLFSQTNCPIIIDFATGTSHGFVSSRVGVAFRMIHVKNTESIGLALTKNHNTCYQCIIENSEAFGLQATGDRHIYVDTIFLTNGAADNNPQVSTKSFSMHYRNAVHNCGTGTASRTAIEYNAALQTTFMFNMVDDCLNALIIKSSSSGGFFWETYHGTGGAGGDSIVATSGTGFGSMVFHTIFANSGTTSPEDDAIEAIAATPFQAVVASIFNDITGDQYSVTSGEPSPIYAPNDVENGNGAITDCGLEAGDISNSGLACAVLALDFWPATLLPTAESYPTGAGGGARPVGGGSIRVPTHEIGTMFDGRVNTDD